MAHLAFATEPVLLDALVAVGALFPDRVLHLSLAARCVRSLAGESHAAAPLPDADHPLLEAVPDVSGKHGVLGEALGVDPRAVKLSGNA